MADEPQYLTGDNLPAQGDSQIMLLHRIAGGIHTLLELAKGDGLEVNASVAPPEGGATEVKQDTLIARVGEVQASPTANTILDRLKALLTGIVLAAGSAIIGKVGIDQTTNGTTNAVFVKNGMSFSIPAFNYQAFTYVGSTNNVATIVFKSGGSGGTTVATLTFTYVASGAADDDKVSSITQS